MLNVEEIQTDPIVPGQSRRAIVVLAPSSATYQGLAQAIEARHPEFDVVLTEPNSLSAAPAADVQLVLVHLRAAASLDPALMICQTYFADCPVGVILESSDQDLSTCEAAFRSRQINGLLPLDLTLDIWLAAMMLLVSGGEYYPLHMPGRARKVADASRSVPILGGQDKTQSLTSREREILALVSEGYQNKLIADRMSLSEHTVKVHVHNVITKLRVSNRTQAAAAYRLNAGWQSPAQRGQW